MSLRLKSVSCPEWNEADCPWSERLWSPSILHPLPITHTHRVVQMAAGESLDFNKELQTVGWSNLWSGLAGSFAGSYSCSQTVFTLKTRTNTRLVGAVVVLTGLFVVLSPWDLVSRLPKLFYGSVLCFIGLDLMSEWLLRSRRAMRGSGFAIVWGTFLSICFLGLVKGLMVGVVVSAARFVAQYSNVMVSRMDPSPPHPME